MQNLLNTLPGEGEGDLVNFARVKRLERVYSDIIKNYLAFYGGINYRVPPEVEIIAMSTAVGAGTFNEADVLYIRITNLDDTNHVGLIFKNENNDEFGVKLDKGQSFIYNGDLAGGVVDTMDAQDGGADLAANTFGDLVNVTAYADTAACDLEVFVACD